MKTNRITMYFFICLTCVLIFHTQPSQAASYKINRTKVSIAIGNSTTLKVNEKNKKVSWSSSNSKIATVTKTGRVTGIKNGKVTITAKIGQKKLSCRVTVLYSSKVTAKKIKATYHKLTNGMVGIYKNNNPYTINLEGTVYFLDAAGQTIRSSKDQNFCLESGRSCILFYPAPIDRENQVIPYASVKKVMTNSLSSHTGYSRKIKVTTSLEPTCLQLSVINLTGKTLNSIRLSFLFYDASGSIMGYMGKYVTCYQNQSSTIDTLYYPVNWIQPSKVKIYIDYAYSF